MYFYCILWNFSRRIALHLVVFLPHRPCLPSILLYLPLFAWLPLSFLFSFFLYVVLAFGADTSTATLLPHLRALLATFAMNPLCHSVTQSTPRIIMNQFPQENLDIHMQVKSWGLGVQHSATASSQLDCHRHLYDPASAITKRLQRYRQVLSRRADCMFMTLERMDCSLCCATWSPHRSIHDSTAEKSAQSVSDRGYLCTGFSV